MFDASPIPAARLQQLGIVNKLTAPGAAVAEALAWAATLAQGPGGAYGRIKRLAYQAEQRGLRDQLDAERDAMVEVALLIRRFRTAACCARCRAISNSNVTVT